MVVSKMEKNGKKIVCFFGICLFLVLILIVILFFLNKKKEETLRYNKIEEIKSHYAKIVISNKDANIYKLEGDEYIEAGFISENEELTLLDTDITYNTKYFPLSTFENYYIKYNDVTPIKKLSIYDDRFKKYIPFNKNIITNEKYKIYDENDKLIYQFNGQEEFPIIINNDDFYGIELNNRLLYIKNESIREIVEHENTTLKNASKIKTLAYHRIYDPKTESCNQVICHTESQFSSHMEYFSTNNWLTLTMEEMELYLTGKLLIPKNSICITIDDGTMDKRAIPILEKYHVNATLFLVTSRFNKQDFIDFSSEFLELESHTHKMHNAGECSGYGMHGGGILCKSDEYILDDIKTSLQVLNEHSINNEAIALAYPFYDYDSRAMSLLKEAGIHLAFIGLSNTEGYAFPNKTNLLAIPRDTIQSYTSYQEFLSYITY